VPYYVGIDLGGTNIATGVVDDQYRILTKYSVRTRGMELPFTRVVENIALAAEEVVRRAGLTMDEIESVGMGTPSCVNPETGLLVHANNMGWHNVPLYAELGKYIKKPLNIRNDADCAALGEVLAGSARRYRDALMITLGTGVGGGMIMGGKIFNGCDHMGAEFGHTKLVFDGITCTCGQHGCFESYGSATALIRQTREAIERNPSSLMARLCAGDLQKVDGKLAFDAARSGDPDAMAVVDRYIRYVAAGLSTLITIFRPQVVIIGGGICAEGDFLLEPLNRRMHECTFAAAEIGVPRAIMAELGNDAGLIGAAMLAKHA
jgi:glucokinase